MKLGWEATGSGVMCEGSPYSVPLQTLLTLTLIQINPQPCKKVKLQAGIKPTALCLVIDKENSIEFLLDFLHYLLSQTSFGHISTNSSTIPTVLRPA